MLTHPAKLSCTAGVTFGMSIVSGALCSTLAYFRTKILPHNILNVLNATTIGSLLTDFQAYQPLSFSLDQFSFQIFVKAALSDRIPNFTFWVGLPS